ncbi:linoleoyl-CoA desaturase [Chitinophaga sp. YR627]|uniref:fatty acid desaturase family protein n=1 Tax=Chitinophaga sp. YR627 TaxID=1881041 RepID=UPI0008EDDD60|nr:acyl-CoA desaturase [Chitinophaga sp. YR627]SFO85835.1 linoleoyl-CoA desaturase [Chitinophaga sp. YR627]
MSIGKINRVKFAPKGNNSFIDALTINVRAYFETNGISPYANARMWIKTIAMLLCYFVPCAFINSRLGANDLLLFWLFWFVMGWGMIGIGACIMHDANHGTYSPNKNVNTFIGHILEIIGGYSITWKIQHNILHHTYTNIDGLDEDVSGFVFLRLSPRQRWRWYHRYQYLYAWFFYMLMTLFWMTVKDYLQIIRYKQHNLLSNQRISLRRAVFQVTFYKIVYYSYILVLPLLFSGQAWYYVLGGFCVMHFTAGLVLSCIFQPSHIISTSPFSLPVIVDSTHLMEDSWAVHELVNTTDFAPKSRLFSWFIGGLNFQIEHHLFTGICHIHYKNISAIVKKTAESFSLPYHVQPTFAKALLEHAKMLKMLGKKDYPTTRLLA